MWCVAELNRDYIAHMEEVLAIYEKPLSKSEPVVCVDEKPVVLHVEVRPARPMRPGRILRCDCEYERRGTANAFCGVEPKTGRHFTRITANRSAARFADYLVEIVAAYPEADTIHLVMDNLDSHRRKALVDRYGERIGGLLWERFTVHYAKTWQLAESGRDRDQPVQPTMPGPPLHPFVDRTAASSQNMGQKNEPGPSENQLAVYTSKSSTEVPL
jgi:hypothetical protein